MKALTILYVEDNDDLRETIGGLMEGEDREVVSCADAEQALVADAARPFDLLVTDVSLPGMSGTDLARHVLAANPSRWVVLCSGYTFRERLPELGPNVRALTKPFELEELDAMIATVAAALKDASTA